MPTTNMKRKTLRALALALSVAILVPAITTAAWPVATRNSYVSQRFHDGHRGLDIAAPRGTAVMPIGNGTVVFAGWRNNCGGYQVWIRHRDGRTHTAYYHLGRESTAKGRYVLGARTRIGTVGTTGCTTGPHVHVEVWKGFPWRTGSYRVNPFPYVDKGYYLPYRYR